MQPWFETVGVLILAFSGIAFGFLTGRIKSKLWLLGYAVPFVLILLVVLPNHSNRLYNYQPFIWLLKGRREFIIFAFAIPMLFGTLIPRLATLRQKILLAIFVIVASIAYFVIPFLGPVFVRKELKKLETTISTDGVCIQTTKYTCGPAAAVTALGQFGINAQEGELAVLAYTAPAIGTSEDLLANAIEKLYRPEGIYCTIRHFNLISELKDNCPAIAIIKLNFFIDHYVAVLEVTDDKVIIGDPLAGKQKLSYEDFKKKWRFVGIVLKRR
jgi:predicted double-glycine peptidase